jgi:hypothetical protein
MGSIGGQELIVIGVIVIMLVVAGAICALPFWFICKKAGLSPWLSLLMLVPLGNVVLPFLLAFIDWPALRNKGANGEVIHPRPGDSGEW